MKTSLACLAIAFAAAASFAADPAAPAPWKHSGDIDWKISGSLPPGAEYHLVYEEPATHAVQLLVKFPADYGLPPHAHTHDETIFVVKGKLEVSAEGASTILEPGSYAVFPAGLQHGLKAKSWGGCEMLVSLNGPFDVKGLPSK